MATLVRVPTRLTLGGGGTDLQENPELLGGGLVLAAGIYPSVYIALNRASFDDHILLKVRKTCVDAGSLQELTEDDYQPMRAALEHVGIHDNIEIIPFGNMTGGTGLGTSSSYLVGILKGLYHYKGVTRLDPKVLAEAAAYVEINMLGRPIGKQDHYMAAYGGFRSLWFDPDGSVKVEDPCIPQTTIDDLQNNLLVFYTWVKRQSGKILAVQKSLTDSGDQSIIGYYKRVKEIGLEILEALRRGDIVRFGQLMHRQWVMKRELPGGVSNQELNDIYQLAMENGAIGGKVTGAGGGGCVVLLADPAKKERLIGAMTGRGMKRINFIFEPDGARILTDFLERHERIDIAQNREINIE